MSDHKDTVRRCSPTITISRMVEEGDIVIEERRAYVVELEENDYK